jgi:hypothetical protein
MNAKKLIGAIATTVVIGASTLSVGAPTANAQSSPRPNTTAVQIESAGWHGGRGWYGRGHGHYGRFGGRHGDPFWHPFRWHPWGWRW